MSDEQKKFNKLFILGLPRTGTTSLCAALLDLGYSVAHTAYTKRSIELATVLADTPIYCDYPFLDSLFPDSKFIYLQRDNKAWLDSIVPLLARTIPKLDSQDRGFNPVIARCFREVFGPFDSGQVPSREYLLQAYCRHEKKVNMYFSQRSECLLTIDIANVESYGQMQKFLGCAAPAVGRAGSFPVLNQAGRIADWDRIRHPRKVGSHERGEDGRKYYDIVQ